MKKKQSPPSQNLQKRLRQKTQGILLDIENSKESVQAKVRDKLKSLRRQSLHQRITKEKSSSKEQSRVTTTKDEKGDCYFTEKPHWFLNHQFHWFHNQITTLFEK